jgi:hypothetical protein
LNATRTVARGDLSNATGGRDRDLVIIRDFTSVAQAVGG